MERSSTFHAGTSSASSASSASASRRNSFSYLEKPSDGSPLSSFSSFTNLKSFSSSRVNLLPMPVVNTASSALEVAKSSLKWSSMSLPSYSPISARSPAAPPTPKLRVVFGNCFYRRIVVWMAAIVSFLILGLLLNGNATSDAFRLQRPWSKPEEQPNPEAVWLNYTRLDGYYQGIRAIVSMDKYHAEFPTTADQQKAGLHITPAENASPDAFDTPVKDNKRDETSQASASASTPVPKPYKPQPDYNSSEYRAKYYPVHQCFLDAANTVPAPDLWAYTGVPQNQPEPLFGSHKLLGLRDDVCFDRFGRYGPYGMGYSKKEGGTGQGLDTENAGSDIIWSTGSGKINYTSIDWAAAQMRCFQANKERFIDEGSNIHGATEYPKPGSLRMKHNGKRGVSPTTAAESTEPGEAAAATPSSKLEKLGRTAIVVRCYAGYKWTPHAVLNFRALITELSLQSGGEYDVHILLDVRDDALPIWADEETAERFVADHIPAEFRGLVTPWSVAQMRVLYPGLFGQPSFENPSNNEIHGVYRSPHLGLQHFAQLFPEYAHYWNWEMDMRFLGSYYEFFNRLGKWSAEQPRRRIWDRSAKYYIPALHGSWDNFTALVDAEAHEAGRPSILGEVSFPGRTATRDEERGISPLPEHGCNGAALSQYNRVAPNATAGESPRRFFADRNNNYTNIPAQCGVGEDADLITLNPMFDSDGSGWVFSNDVTGYDLDFAIPPRRTSIITASRLSRRLLFAMHEETWRLHHGMFAEMFPPSIALHRGFKAAYAPHPVYTDRQWPLLAAEKAFNAGPDHSSGGSHDSPFLQANEHYQRGMTWYYNSDFAGRLWRRWLGYLQPLDDGAAPRTPESIENSLSGLGGGPGEEERESGRMCMRSVLVHPIKFESLEEIMP